MNTALHEMGRENQSLQVCNSNLPSIIISCFCIKLKHFKKASLNIVNILKMQFFVYLFNFLMHIYKQRYSRDGIVCFLEISMLAGAISSHCNWTQIIIHQHKYSHLSFSSNIYIFPLYDVQITTTKVQNRKWADDSVVKDCMGCQKKFSVTNRRVSQFVQ